MRVEEARLMSTLERIANEYSAGWPKAAKATNKKARNRHCARRKVSPNRCPRHAAGLISASIMKTTLPSFERAKLDICTELGT